MHAEFSFFLAQYSNNPKYYLWADWLEIGMSSDCEPYCWPSSK